MNAKYVFGLAALLVGSSLMSATAQTPAIPAIGSTPTPGSSSPFAGLPGFGISMMQPSPVAPPTVPGAPMQPAPMAQPMTPPMAPMPMAQPMTPPMAPMPMMPMTQPPMTQTETMPAMNFNNPIQPAAYQGSRAPGDGLHAAHWVTDSPPDALGPVGRNGSIGEEIYVRVGPSFGISGAKLDNLTQTGIAVNLGLKTLFFNPAEDRAWTVDVGVLYQRNNGEADEIGMPQFDGRVNLRALTRTSVNIGVGREWWMWAPATNRDITNWRFGLDLGGRYGAGHGDFGVIGNPIAYYRKEDVFGGFYLGINNTLEIPMNGWWALIGFRTEYGVTWGDFIPSGGTQIHEINAWLTAGLRF
ncbi:hypothetical protein [Tuwongella immobilis]|uniref:Outer membrane protein beta-barrel domain-containing protein n=1 Tax=Tuwongella immobilis TaxID=692036 RepID=A0A6C2YKI2_9BACT|nr:hypothetical protein [Tuwongella immobilis]VIP01811.1 unnamed protein product [Tuwongella immobilis]VTR99522.1 unnamed protein product [Tuwongella immobilis]